MMIIRNTPSFYFSRVHNQRFFFVNITKYNCNYICNKLFYKGFERKKPMKAIFHILRKKHLLTSKNSDTFINFFQ